VINPIKRLFLKHNQSNLGSETSNVRQTRNQSIPNSGFRSQLCPKLSSGAAQSIGQQRDHNEDSLLKVETAIFYNNSCQDFGLFIVADGMGGHQFGEIASNVAVRTVADHVLKDLYLPLISFETIKYEINEQRILRDGVMEANKAINKFAPGGGTTLTAALVLGTQVTIAHIGDSRAYMIFSNGTMQLLTRDHSLVNRLVELGQITLSEAATHPQRNVLIRALGQGEPFEPDVHTYPLPDLGYLLLCSDGLWGVVTESDITQIVINAPNAQTACDGLIDAANMVGGADNITAIVIKFTQS
jgi:serine/threonine protein phosphatase PrpC